MKNRKIKINKRGSKFSDKPSFKWVVCSKCKAEEVKVSEEAISAICSICVQRMIPPPVFKSQEAPKSTGRPRGWQFMKLFVDRDGNVFHKGVEQPKMKGKLPPTDVKTNGKKSRFEREQDRLAKETKLAKKYQKKQEKKNGNSNRRKRTKKTK